MTIQRTALTLLASLTVATAAHAGGRDTWATTSHLLALGLPLAAGVTSWSRDDTAGLWQLGGSLAMAAGGSELITALHKKPRPDGSGDDSFPSSHAAVAFAAARYLDKRYDTGWAPVVYGAAALTGLARVRANKHDWPDVLVGAGLGYLSAELMTSHRGLNVAVLPNGQGGVTMVSSLAW